MIKSLLTQIKSVDHIQQNLLQSVSEDPLTTTCEIYQAFIDRICIQIHRDYKDMQQAPLERRPFFEQRLQMFQQTQQHYLEMLKKI